MDNEDIIILLSCLSSERFEKEASSIVCCIFQIYDGSNEGLSVLLQTIKNREFDSFMDDNLKILWTSARHLGQEDLAKFDIDSLHLWAITDNPGRYEWYAIQEEFAKIGESLLFG